jgi:hypothetical protein
MLTYTQDGRCYLRKRGADGDLAGGFVAFCGDVRAGARAYVALDPDDLGRSLDVTDPASPVALTVAEEPLDPAPSDVYLGPCDALADPGARAGQGCVYAPRTKTIHRVPGAVAVDPYGRVWSNGSGGRVAIDGHVGDSIETLPGPATTILTSRGELSVAWTRGRPATVLLGFRGVNWEGGIAFPHAIQTRALVHLADDGGVFLGPRHGVLWRMTSATGHTFAATTTGPIATVVAAGTTLYGLPDPAAAPPAGGKVWLSRDGATTWSQILDGAEATSTTPTPAEGLAGAGPSAAGRIIDTALSPADFAANQGGGILVIYGGGRPSAWRLYGSDDRVVAQGLDAYWVDSAGDGFVLWQSDGPKYVDARGRVSVLHEDPVPLPIRRGDVLVPGQWIHGDVDYLNMVRPSDGSKFRGTADPDGHPSVVDAAGRLWALGETPAGRTVVRWATPGGPWHSRDLGPDIGARRVQGSGTVLLVPGMRQIYLSSDMGRTWSLRRHTASHFAGRPPRFMVLPDGSILGGKGIGWSVSSDLVHFRTLSVQEAGRIIDNAGWARTMGTLFAHGKGRDITVSLDRVHRYPFSPEAVHVLLAEQSDRPVHP